MWKICNIPLHESYNYIIQNWYVLFSFCINKNFQLINLQIVKMIWWISTRMIYLFTWQHEKKYFIWENKTKVACNSKSNIFEFLFIFSWTFNFVQTSFITTFCIFRQNEIWRVPTSDIDVHFRHTLLSLFVIITLFALSFYIKCAFKCNKHDFYSFQVILSTSQFDVFKIQMWNLWNF